MSDLFDLSGGINFVESKNSVVQNDFFNSDDFLSPSKKVADLNKEIEWVFTHHKKEFLEQILLLFRHKSVSVRRKVADGIIKIADKNIIRSLQDWKNFEPDRKVWLSIEILIDKLERGLNVEKEIQVLTVSEAVEMIKKTIGDKKYIIEGELSEVKEINQMIYFNLKDSEEVRLNCWAFIGVLRSLDFPLNEGLNIRVSGNFKLSKNGSLYFNVGKIQLTGEGEIARNLKLLEEKLLREGLFEESAKQKIPLLPENILLIASPNSAALDDFLKVSKQRRGGLNIWLLPIKTQGVSAEFGILQELEKVNYYCQKFKIDTVVLTRGGGSKDDLFIFNSEKIVRALYAIQKPLIVAIGHERDFTLAEKVADLRCSTPSQSAEKVSLSLAEVSNIAQNSILETKNSISTKIHQYRLVKTNLLQLIVSNSQRSLLESKEIVQNCVFSFINLINSIKSTLYEVYKLKYQIEQQIKNYQWQNQRIYNQIRQDFGSDLLIFKNKFILLDEKISAINPQKILAQGYALIWQKKEQSEEWQVVDSVSKFDQNSTFLVEWFDGKKELGNQKN